MSDNHQPKSRQTKAEGMGLLEVAVGTASVLTRLFAYVLLRVIPGHIGTYTYYFFLAQVVGVLIINAKLRFIEKEPERTIQVEQERHKKEVEQDGSNGTPKSAGKKHKKKNSQHQKTPSYAEMAAKGTKAEHHDEVEEELAVTKRPPTAHLAKSMSIPSRPNPLHWIAGAPSSSRSFNWASLGLNALLVAMCADFQFRPLLGLNVHDTTFVRVGDVTPTTVKLVARLPPSLFAAPAAASRHNHTIYHGVTPTSGASIVYRPTRPSGPWHYAGELSPEAETDYVGALKLFSLLPSTEYEYAIVLPEEQSHRFNPPTVEHPQYFRTAPDPRLAVGNTHFKFAASSCIKPGWPYGSQSHLAIKGAAELADRIHPDKIDFLMFMGDFIYADVPSKIETQAAYAKKYRQTFASPDYRRIYESIPTYHIYDDHELENDYAGEGKDSKYFQLANPAYSAYLGSGNPDPLETGQHYYTFQRGDAAFFVMDTRRYRSQNEAVDDEDKTMLGERQKEHLLNWLESVNQTVTFKFIVSSVPFLSLWGGPNGQLDTWAGFMHERNELMDILAYVPNVIVLSGDRHEFAAAIIREKVIDFSISPLNQFYLPIRTLSQKHGAGATGEDRLLKYIPDGSRKYATFEVDTRTVNMPTVSMQLYVDGEEKYDMTIVGQPIRQPIAAPSTGLGKSLALSLSELLGLGKGWF